MKRPLQEGDIAEHFGEPRRDRIALRAAAAAASDSMMGKSDHAGCALSRDAIGPQVGGLESPRRRQ